MHVSSDNSVAVIGAGIAGLSAAVFLQRSGYQVSVYDGQPPGTGASYGNGGLLSPGSCMPIALPGMLRKVPGWIIDPNGPLSVHPRHIPAAIPWLLRWIKAGSRAQVDLAAEALWSLHSVAFDAYKELLGEQHFSDLIRQTGQIYVWESAGESAGDRIYDTLRRRYNIPFEPLPLDELRELVPEISPAIKRAEFYPKNGHTVNPLRLVQTIGRLFVDAGGVFCQERVMKILRQASGFRIVSNLSDRPVARIVVAAGVWSKQLLAPLGIALPLEPERGYHVEVVRPSMSLRFPVLHKERAMGAIQMEGGLRIAGTVEIAGLDLPLDEHREDAMLKNALALFPSLEFERSSLWMGFRPSTPDSLPILGEVDGWPGLYLATGHGHTGMTAGAVSGRLIAEVMSGSRTSIDPHPFRLSRF